MHSDANGLRYQSIAWQGEIDGELILLDQIQLPAALAYLHCQHVEEVFESIVNLQVRGAPAIGIAAAYGACLSLRHRWHDCSLQEAIGLVEHAIERLATSRPTAVNLFWALDRMRAVIREIAPTATTADFARRLLSEARAIHEEDRQMCRLIGQAGATLFKDGMGILTHCNTGGLATAELGTALSAIVTAHQQGKRLHVFVDETRPLLQGARLTTWELMRFGLPCTLICDSMAAHVMQQGKVQAVIVGADRITSRGDTANKIGTYGLAVLAKHHRIPFYVAAPSSTFDLSLNSGDDIPIEQRSRDEIISAFGKQTAPSEVQVYNPAFDVTPAELIHAIITERGILQPVSETVIRKLIGNT